MKNIKNSCLVLEGGGKRGIYTAGVLDVLMENHIMIDCVIGTSAGCIHGCSYASQQIGRSIRYNMKYGKDPRFMSFKNWIKTGNIVDTEFSYHTLPEKLDPVDNETFKKLGINLYTVCTNLETGKAEYIKCNDMFKDIDYIRASASLPFLSKIVKINGKKLLDGSIADSIPLKKAEELGYKKNIVVLTRVKGYKKKPSLLIKLLTPIVYRKFPNFVKAMLNRHNMYNEQIQYIEKSEVDKDTIVIRPSRYIKVGRIENNLSVIKKLYDLGRYDAIQMLPKIKKFFDK